MAIYAILAVPLLVVVAVAALGFRFAKLLESRQRKVLYILVILGSTGVGVQVVHGFVTSYRWAQQHQHHQHRPAGHN